MININLDKYANIPYNKIDTSDKLYKLLTINSKKELIEFTKNEPLLERYTKKIIELSSDKKYKEEEMSYELEKNLMNQELYLMGEDAGIEKGIEKNKVDMIINMLNKKLSLDFISDVVKLPIKEVRKIIVKYKKQNNIK